MGGDEFVVLLTDIGSASEAEAVGSKVVLNVSAPAVIASRPLVISASVGVCTYPEGGQDGDSLLQHVDAAMYQAKGSGRNSFSVYMRS
jgi:diguanylate cyclase (GGDEF)-like protein